MRPTGKAYRDFLNGRLKRTFNPSQYARWRQTIPFTQEQIADAFAELIAHTENEFLRAMYVNREQAIRLGYLSSKDLSVVLPILIKTCSICGKTALYRVAAEGRCKKHKDVKNVFAERRIMRAEARSAEIIQTDKIIRKIERAHQYAKTTTKFR